MGQRINRLTGRRRTGGVLLAVTALVSTILVSTTAGVSGADPVSTKIPMVCVGADSKTTETLNLAKALIGSDKVFVDLTAAANDIPTNAGLEEEIDATFQWSGTMDQNLIDKSAGLNLALAISNIKSVMSVRGPADVDRFDGTGTNTNISPVAGKPAVLNIGKIGGAINTTAGGIITYRVAGVTLTAALSLSGQNFVLNLTCSPVGSNLIAKTAVKDPDAPVFNPEVVQRQADAGETVTVDMNEVIMPGKTPLIPDSVRIVEAPGGGTATIEDGILTFQAPSADGTYSITVEACGEPKAEAGMPGVNEVQNLLIGDNWVGGLLGPRPVGFTLKFGDEETRVIWTASTVLGPILDPLPRGGIMPNSNDWAPADRAGQVNDYLFGIDYEPTNPAAVQAALEALPSIGAGNVKVTQSADNSKVFDIEFIGDLAEQDVPQVELAGWFAVPPQEILDRIGEAVAGIAGSLGGDEDADTSVADGLNAAAGIAPGDASSVKIQKANDYMGNRILEAIGGGAAVSDAEWDWWFGIVILDPLMDAVPAILEWLNSLFPKKVVMSTATAGEAPIPPEPLCAQGLVEIVVQGTAVDSDTDDNGSPSPDSPSVKGTGEERGVGFTG